MLTLTHFPKSLTHVPTVFPLDIPSVNYHLLWPCNMRCGFCFATFQDVRHEMGLSEGHLPEADCLSIVDRLADAGFEKLNFAGGEPMLCSFLPNLIRRAKARGMVTSIVTNGSKLTDAWLADMRDSLDWIGLSIDTVDREKMIRLGRAIRGRTPITEEEYLHTIREIKRHEIRLKINTVVTSDTWQEDFTDFIRLAQPERWKIFQALPIKGQNDEQIANFVVTPEQFKAYVQRHCCVEVHGIDVVPETNELMMGSYVMIDPAGRFFDDTQGVHTYSRPILEVGVEEALKDISVDAARFLERGGKYDW